MAWIFFQESEASASPCPHGSKRWRIVNAKNTRSLFSSLGWPMEASTKLRSGMMSLPLMGDNSEELWTSFLVDSHVKTSRALGLAKEWKASEAGFLQRLCALPKKSGRSLSSSKTYRLSAPEDWATLCGNWPGYGMTRGGVLYPLTMWERRTREKDGSSLPTPTAQDFKRRGPTSKQQGLPEHVLMWPTPRAGKTSDESLENFMARKGRGDVCTPPLTLAVKMWPTPTAHNAKECASPSEFNRNTPTLAAAAGGQLNPDWVEYLMGFATGWTRVSEDFLESRRKKKTASIDSDVLEIASSPRKSAKRSKDSCLVER